MSDRAEQDIFERVERFRRRRPAFTDDVITMAHGAGGKSSAALLDAVFLDAFRDPGLHERDDGAVLSPTSDTIVLTTDSFVVTPWRFPGGSIGHLAIHGTVNDVSVMGATPRWLSAAFVIEEGFPVADLRSVVADMAEAATEAGVAIVTGDTKVVERGAADGLYITTTGVGTRASNIELGAERVRVGDKVLVSGAIGDHGMAIMLARGNLVLQADIRSDTAALNGLISTTLHAAPEVRWIRDPTRGGVASALNELAVASGFAIELDETAIPVSPATAGACELLGLDPLHVANEGRIVAVVASAQADQALAAMRSHPLGAGAAIVGDILEDPPSLVMLRTPFGGTRIVDQLVGDPLPRIC